MGHLGVSRIPNATYIIEILLKFRVFRSIGGLQFCQHTRIEQNRIKRTYRIEQLYYTNRNLTIPDDLFEVPNISIIAWILLAQYFFYGSGHQPTFPNISWEAAFIGISGDFSNNFLPGTLIIINTFCSFILMGVTLPLLLVTPFTIFVMSPSIVGKKMELVAASARGEVILFEKHHMCLSSLMTLSCKYVIGHGIRVSLLSTVVIV